MNRSGRILLVKLFKAALKEVDPYRGVFSRLEFKEDKLVLSTPKGLLSWPVKRFKEIWILGAGKAALAMAAACEDRLRDRLTSGLIVTPRGYGGKLAGIECLEAGHPLPDRSSLRAGNGLLRRLKEARAETLVLFLTSGGGSALYTVPFPPLTLSDKRKTTELLMKCGADIGELNAVRKHLSWVKGGWSARWAFPATVIHLVLSDVVGDPLAVIGSGPFSPDPTTYGEVWRIFQRYELIPRLPRSVIHHVQKGRKGTLPETPKRGDPCFSRVQEILIGNNRAALEGARKQAEALGYKTFRVSSEIQGEVGTLARFYGAALREKVRLKRGRGRPLCLLAGGEPTVIVKGKGKGGRNTELALAVAREIRGLEGVFFMSVGTDGCDGPTDAAGAWVDGKTWDRAIQKGLDPERFLAENDSYAFFHLIGGLIKTGPTGTNVMDLHIALID